MKNWRREGQGNGTNSSESWFSITFRRKLLHAAISKKTFGKGGQYSLTKKHYEGVNGGISEGLKTVLDFIEKTPGLRAPQISKALDIPAKTLERQEKGKSEPRITRIARIKIEEKNSDHESHE